MILRAVEEAASHISAEEIYAQVRSRYPQMNILVCQKCGEIIDVEESIVSPLWAEIQRKYNFKVDMKHVAFFGLCPRCQG